MGLSRNSLLRSEKDDRQGGYVLEMQRARLLAATVEVVYERGVQGVTIASVCQRAGMSRKTFYDLFEDRQGCLLAALDRALDHVREAIEEAVAAQQTWADRVRAGLIALLSFLDCEPAMARLLIVEALGGGAQVLNARRSALLQAVAVIDEGRTQVKANREPPPLTAEGIVGAVLSVIHTRMLEQDARPLMELAGSLMAIIVQPYLGLAAAQKELDRCYPRPKRFEAGQSSDPFKDLPLRLTYRTVRVLSCIARNPGASNKRIARVSGVTDEGQMSRLLTRLEKVGLVRNLAIEFAKGGTKAWSLTSRGDAVLQAVGRDE